MEKYNIEVPEGIKFMGNWIDFALPAIPHIMNKIVTGCGFTEYFLRPNPKYPRVILISPRRVLLENKESQHNNPTDGIDIGKIYYARNDLEIETGYDIDINVDDKAAVKDYPKPTQTEEEKRKEEIKKKIKIFKDNILNYVSECWYDNNRDVRIIVTYDSFRLVREALGNDIYNYQIVVDEFQSLMSDSVFKSDTELSLLYHLRDLRKVCFLSATPMLDKYLERLSSFKDLPYYQLDWETQEPGRIRRPNLDCKQTISIITSAREEITKYLEGNFERYSWRDESGMIQEIYSKELVIYCNSVKNICDIIRKCNLTPEQVNILCAKTEENRKKINQAFKAVDSRIPTRGKSYIGSVPKKGETHKMFTFCTRTVYLGADFYSTCARSLILSDANIDCLAVDISMDLLQILGRQRLVGINPWANSAIFHFKTNTRKKTEEEFRKMIEEKIDASKDLLQGYQDASTPSVKHRLAENFQMVAKIKKYKTNYVAVNIHGGSDLVPCFNELVLIAEERAFDVQKIDYKDRFSVMSEVSSNLGINTSQEINNFLHVFDQMTLGKEKIKYLCEFLKVRRDLEEEILINVPLAYKNYYKVLGPERCYAFNYRMSLLEKEYQKQLQNQGISGNDLRDLVYSTFQEGERYTKSQLKEVVQGIYNHIGLKKTGKASDFEEWYNLKRCTITDPDTKKKQEGYILVNKK